MDKKWIIIDWGTTNFRAWLVDSETRQVADTLSDDRGLNALTPEQFPLYCMQQLEPWRKQGSIPVYLAGMVGAAQGWQYAPQLPVPVMLNDLARHVIAVEGMDDIWIIPGVKINTPHPDLMRGEEVQIFGALEITDRHSALLCLPGTHSKWARVSQKALVDFSTVMTGEVYALLLRHSILGRSVLTRNSLSNNAFEQGLIEADSRGGLLHQMFSARSKNIAGSLADQDVADFVSGLLIGSEVNAMQALYPIDDAELLLVSSTALQQRYYLALQRAGYACRKIDSAIASVQGICQIISHHQGEQNVA